MKGNILHIVGSSVFFQCLFIQIHCSVRIQREKPLHDRSYEYYNRKLLEKHQYKDYLAAIFENENTRQDFAKFINTGLTDQIKDDLKAIEIQRETDSKEILPVVLFQSDMDTWLGVLPAWKRIKKFMFGKFDAYITAHPEIMKNVRIYKPRHWHL